MPYKISGDLSDVARIIVIKESDWSIELNTLVTDDTYEIDPVVGGKKMVMARKSDGEVLAYGNIEPSYYEEEPEGGTVDVSVSAGADDGYIWDGSCYPSEDRFAFGELYGYDRANCWMKFNNITIPQGATITEATVTVVCKGEYPFNDSIVTATIYANDENNAVAPTSVSEYNTLSTTSASVVWVTSATWDAGQEFSTPDIKSLVQEVVNRAGWESGNSIMILIKGNNNYDYPGKDCASYENETYGPPQLSITYE